MENEDNYEAIEELVRKLSGRSNLARFPNSLGWLVGTQEEPDLVRLAGCKGVMGRLT